jgi:chromosome segregation ATPase
MAGLPGHCGGWTTRLIRLVLYFALGFLSAVFLAVLIAPALWRRAVMLTRRRIEASVPLTTDEIRAERDGLRAQHALEVRRLEMELKAANDRAASASAKHARGRKDVKSAADERETAKSELISRETALREAREEVRKRQARIDALAGALEKTEALLQTQRDAFDKLGREFEEASMSSSARQIELVARESEINRLVSDISTLKGQRRSSDRVSRDAEGRIRAAEEAMGVERRRADELNTKVLQLLATLSDREERLERREREITRLRERLRPMLTAPSDEQFDLRLADLAAENVRLEAEIVELLERHEEASPQRGMPAKVDRQASLKLRQQMADLAAQVVHMTAALEGPDSPLNKIIGKNEGGPKRGKPASLADRIRLLQRTSEKNPT